MMAAVSVFNSITTYNSYICNDSDQSSLWHFSEYGINSDAEDEDAEILQKSRNI